MGHYLGIGIGTGGAGAAVASRILSMLHFTEEAARRS
jgi:hypothetical protein